MTGFESIITYIIAASLLVLEPGFNEKASNCWQVFSFHILEQEIYSTCPQEVYNQSFNNWAQPLSGEPVFGLSGDNGPSPYSVRSVLKGDFSRKHVLFLEGVRVMVHFK
jgi:hypothetical protein